MKQLTNFEHHVFWVSFLRSILSLPNHMPLKYRSPLTIYIKSGIRPTHLIYAHNISSWPKELVRINCTIADYKNMQKDTLFMIYSVPCIIVSITLF
jgi:hypothetical protein